MKTKVQTIAGRLSPSQFEALNALDTGQRRYVGHLGTTRALIERGLIGSTPLAAYSVTGLGRAVLAAIRAESAR